MTTLSDWLTLAEAEQEFGIKADTLRRALYDGRLPGMKRAKTWFVRREDVKRYAEEYTPRNRGGDTDE